MSIKLRVIKGIEPSKTPLSEKGSYQEFVIDQYYKVLPLRYAKGSIGGMTSALANYLPWLQDKGLFIWEIKPHQYDDFSKHLSNNISNGTLCNYNAQLSNFYDWLIIRRGEEIKERFGTRTVNPIDRWNTPQRRHEDNKFPEVPDGEVVNYYFQKLKQEFAEALENGNKRKMLILGRTYTAEQIMFKAGLRVQEVANLRVGDIDLQGMVIFVFCGKGNKDRIVDISEKLGPVLKWYLTQIHPLRKDRMGLELKTPLFVSEYKSQISKITLTSKNQKQQDAYNIPLDKRFSPHGLRRLYATNLYTDLISEKHPDPIMYIKKQLGHVFLSTTLRYCRVQDSLIARAKKQSMLLIKNVLADSEVEI